MKNKYTIIFYYFYVKIYNIDKFKKYNYFYSIKLNIKGEFFIFKNKIFGLISGLKLNCFSYINFLKFYFTFYNINFFIFYYNDYLFKNLNFNLKKKIYDFNSYNNIFFLLKFFKFNFLNNKFLLNQIYFCNFIYLNKKIYISVGKCFFCRILFSKLVNCFNLDCNFYISVCRICFLKFNKIYCINCQ